MSTRTSEHYALHMRYDVQIANISMFKKRNARFNETYGLVESLKSLIRQIQRYRYITTIILTIGHYCYQVVSISTLEKNSSSHTRRDQEAIWKTFTVCPHVLQLQSFSSPCDYRVIQLENRIVQWYECLPPS